MTGRNAELDSFLEVLRKRLASADVSDPRVLRATLEAADVLDLPRETAEFDDALEWLIGVVSTTAHYSASAAFALAGRFAAQRCLGGLTTADVDALNVTSAVVNPLAASPWAATVPALFAPDAVVLLDRSASSAARASWDPLAVEATEDARRSGLPEAALQTVRLGDIVEMLPDAVAQRAARDWDLLTSAVALGIAERALATAETYADERQQFGSAIATFAGLRAMLVEMHLSVSGVRGMLDRAVLGEIDPEEVLAIAGRVAVDVCLEAIQVHGGYGYIDEYPLAGMLRDAVSVRARGGGRRALVAQVAGRRLGKPENSAR